MEWTSSCTNKLLHREVCTISFPVGPGWSDTGEAQENLAVFHEGSGSNSLGLCQSTLSRPAFVPEDSWREIWQSMVGQCLIYQLFVGVNGLPRKIFTGNTVVLTGSNVAVRSRELSISLGCWDRDPLFFYTSSYAKHTTHTERYVYIYIYIHTYMHACMHAYIHTYIHVHTYLYLYSVYIYIYMHKSRLATSQTQPAVWQCGASQSIDLYKVRPPFTIAKWVQISPCSLWFMILI